MRHHRRAASARGLGKATAKLMAEHGAQVVILDLDKDAANAAARDIARSGYGLACDVTDLGACRQAAETVLEYSGRIDVLVNNAGISQPLKLMDISQGDYDAVLDVSLTRHPQYEPGRDPDHAQPGAPGRSSAWPRSPVSRAAASSAVPTTRPQKPASSASPRRWRASLAPTSIRVNCIAPSLINTDITLGKLSDERKAEIISGVPLGRVGEADDVAGVAVFLASDLSSYVTGATIDVNGGSLAPWLGETFAACTKEELQERRPKKFGARWYASPTSAAQAITAPPSRSPNSWPCSTTGSST